MFCKYWFSEISDTIGNELHVDFVIEDDKLM